MELGLEVEVEEKKVKNGRGKEGKKKTIFCFVGKGAEVEGEDDSVEGGDWSSSEAPWDCG